ncbi:Enamine deaminase RidA, house cleaning of reactive enamine intermediates, YjgF/YER057c/UK114 family [Micromonospora citrea]|uniref:Enamine deaminase RidA, house cleaning of reactive enamine intermediates, YjgF/YER057c/UK114 family n=1 Tax=Micromonospora citrea TaxID=47855 RepID=A0A1C6VQP6_9ACTN|nr:RidA family protein [Micromonospora citrea]SCL68678.1 Enamine deaminase RidA, house cleaning of reactive enamine intermediates, YjgF/YER057c/UK114 family [Micromonospora citrea]
MPHTISNPDTLHDPVSYGYSHVARVSGELVLVAGQYASDATGQVTSPDFAAQVRQSFANLGKALAAEGLEHRHIVQLRTHIVDHDADKLAVVAGVIGEIWGATPPTQTLTGVAALALPDMLFEVDAVAARP